VIRSPRLSPKATWAGDTQNETFYILADGVPVDTTSATLTYTWRRAMDSDAPYVVSKTQSDASLGGGTDNNAITIPLSASDTAVPAGTYIATLRVTAGGSHYTVTRQWLVEEAP